MIANPAKDTALQTLPVPGTRRKHWQIVNVLGGLVTYFEGTEKQARVEAARLQRSRSANQLNPQPET